MLVMSGGGCLSFKVSLAQSNQRFHMAWFSFKPLSLSKLAGAALRVVCCADTGGGASMAVTLITLGQAALGHHSTLVPPALMDRGRLYSVSAFSSSDTKMSKL